jgi:hypothetical protein
MVLDETTAIHGDLEQLIAALRAWYSATGDARPNRILADLGGIRLRNGGRPDNLTERGLLLYRVRQWGDLAIPDPAADDFVTAVEAAARGGGRTRDPYPRRATPHK